VERILRKKEYEARIAKQQEVEREYEDHQRAVEQAKSGVVEAEKPAIPARPATPNQKQPMPGSFDSPEDVEVANNELNRRQQQSEKGVLNQWAKKLGFKNTNTDTNNAQPQPKTDGPQMSRDLQATKANIQNAIKECRPTNMEAISSKHHQDPTELDKGGYCNGEQWENLHKAFTLPYSGRHVDIYYGKDQSESPKEIQADLTSFLPLIFGLTSIFGVNPAAVSIFLDKKSNTVAFNQSGSLFFNLAWFMGLHSAGFGTEEGRLRALDSWFFTYCHELAHNLVADHNARHNWYNQQIAIEYSQPYRRALAGFLQDIRGGGQRALNG